MSGSQSLERGIAVLELLDAAMKPLGVRDIARRLDVSPPIVQRLLYTLVGHHYVKQDEETRRYSIGYGVLSLGASLTKSDNMLVTANAELQSIASLHKLNGYLGILRGNRAVYMLSVQSEGPVAIRNEPGETARFHTTALGKIILAHEPEDVAIALLGPRPLEKITNATITDPALILKGLPEIRKNGHVAIFDENIMGVVSVGAPIRDAGGHVRAALSVAFARQFEPDLEIEAVIKLVVKAAGRISASLGFASFAK